MSNNLFVCCVRRQARHYWSNLCSSNLKNDVHIQPFYVSYDIGCNLIHCVYLYFKQLLYLNKFCFNSKVQCHENLICLCANHFYPKHHNSLTRSMLCKTKIKWLINFWFNEWNQTVGLIYFALLSTSPIFSDVKKSHVFPLTFHVIISWPTETPSVLLLRLAGGSAGAASRVFTVPKEIQNPREFLWCVKLPLSFDMMFSFYFDNKLQT